MTGEAVKLTEVEAAMDRLATFSADAREWSAHCADARTWGGPTIYPPNLLDEHRAAVVSRDVMVLIQVIDAAISAGRSAIASTRTGETK